MEIANSWELQHEEIIKNLVSPCFGSKKLRAKGVKTFISIIMTRILGNKWPELEDKSEEIIRSIKEGNTTVEEKLSKDEQKNLKDIILKNEALYYEVIYMRRRKKEINEQQVRRKILSITGDFLNIKDASIILVQSGLCQNLITDFTALSDKITSLGLPVGNRNPDKEENWCDLEDASEKSF